MEHLVLKPSTENSNGRRLGLYLLAVLAAGIAVGLIVVLYANRPGPSVAGSEDTTATPTSTRAPAPTPEEESIPPEPEPDPTPETPVPVLTAEPIGGLSEQERSDLYWYQVTDFDHYERFADLAEMTDFADLVIVGRIMGTSVGQRFPMDPEAAELMGPWEELLGLVAIDQVLKGDPVMRNPGVVEVAGMGTRAIHPTDLPGEPFLLFLKHDLTWRAESGIGEHPYGTDPNYYVRPNPYQTGIRQIEGVIDIVEGPEGWERAFGPFPSGLDGRDFEEVVDEVRRLAADH